MDSHDGGLAVVEGSDGTVVRMWGSVDESLRAQASAVMAHTMSRDGGVVVDAGDLEFVDSSGLAFILAILRAGEEDGRAVLLRDPPLVLLEMLEVLGLDSQVPLEFSSV